jgi:hypothetical protein
MTKMKLKKLSALCSAAILSISSLLLIALPGVTHALGTTFTWCNIAGGDFNTDTNWSIDGNCSDASSNTQVPAGTGDLLVFDDTNLTGDVTINDDISGLSLAGLTFSGTNNSFDNYTISGDAMTLTGGISTAADVFPTIDNDLTLANSQSFTGDGAINFGDQTATPVLNIGAFTLTVGSGSDSANFYNNNGSISGTGSLVIDDGSQATLSSASSAWTAGTVTVDTDGLLQLNPNSLGSVSSVNLTGTGSLCLSGFSGAAFPQDLTLGGSEALSSAASCGRGGGPPTYTPAASVDLTGSVTLTADTTVDTEGTITVSGPLSGAFTLGLDSGSIGTGILDIASSNNTSDSPNTPLKTSSTTTSSGTTPKTPDTGLARIAGNPLAVLLVTMSAATILVFTSYRLKTSRR